MLNDVDPESEDIFTEGLIEHYVQRPNVMENVCLADFASRYTFHEKSVRKNVEEEEASDVENSVEKNCCYERSEKIWLKDRSGYVIARRNRKIIRYRRYSANNDEYNYYREQIMLFVPWRNELSLQDDVKKIYEESFKKISIGRKKYCKFEREFGNEENDTESLNESDSEDEGCCIADFAIFNLNNSEADISTEVSVLKEQIKAGKGSDLFALPKLLCEDDYCKLVTMLNEKQKTFLLDYV